MRTSFLILALLFVFGAPSAALAQYEIEPAEEPESEEEAMPWHFDLDAAIGSTSVRFVTATDLARMCPAELMPCGIPNIVEAAFRGTAGIGYKGFTLEGAYTIGLDGPPTPTYRVLNIGVRFDTSWDGLFSLFFRFSMTNRLGEVGGAGAHGGIGLLARPHNMLAFYFEMSADITSGVAFNESQKPLFSYATFFVGGVRFSLGP